MRHRLLGKDDLLPGDIIRGMDVIRDVEALTGGFPSTDRDRAKRARIRGLQLDQVHERLVAIVTGESRIICRHRFLANRQSKRTPRWASAQRRISLANLMYLMGAGTVENLAFLIEVGVFTVHDLLRFQARTPLPRLVAARIETVFNRYDGTAHLQDPATDLRSALAHPAEWSRLHVSGMIAVAVADGTIAGMYADGTLSLDTVLRLINEQYMDDEFEPIVKVGPRTRNVPAVIAAETPAESGMTARSWLDTSELEAFTGDGSEFRTDAGTK